MSNKLTSLKKKFISQAIKSGIMILGCAIAFSAAYYFYQSSEDSIKSLKTRDSQLKRKIVELKSNNSSAGTKLAKFEKLQSDGKIKPLELNRKRISNLLSQLSDIYRINNVNININPLKERTGAPFTQESGTIVTTNITLTFDSPSDVHAFAFIEKLTQEFPGYLNMKTLAVSRTGEVSEDTVRSLLKGGRANFIKNSVNFGWLGLRPNPEKGEQ